MAKSIMSWVLPGQVDCLVSGTGKTLSQLYREKPEWFNCDTAQLPIRVNILDPPGRSVRTTSPGRCPARCSTIVLAVSRRRGSFWIRLLMVVSPLGIMPNLGRVCSLAKATRLISWFVISRPKKTGTWRFAGTLHAIGKDVLTYNISRNADLTYRLFDYHRIDPTTDMNVNYILIRLSIMSLCQTIVKLQWFDSTEEAGCILTRYWNEPGLYTLTRLKTVTAGHYSQPRFSFITVVEGDGYINGIEIKKGETIFVPDSFGDLFFREEWIALLPAMKTNNISKEHLHETTTRY